MKSAAQQYQEAVDKCDLVTERLTCINRKLEEEPSSNGICDAVRARVKTALDHHIRYCEELGHKCE